jgi:threonyl-tRNA synthetase
MKSHREIAEQLDLFHSEPDGPGMIFWHPNGWRLFQTVQNHMRRVYQQSGFEEISTPLFLKKRLWEVSGHLEKFAHNMFLGGDSLSPEEYALKPMSCPAHILSYKRGVYSYRDLPLRMFEFGTVHRNEPSGSLNGCLRLRQFTQDDAHVFCEWSQAETEIIAFLCRAKQVYSHYGYTAMEVKISTRPENAFGEPSDWKNAEATLAAACQGAGYAYQYQIGEGAFYGPKIELSLKDAMGREWQCGTIQLDFNLPQRFDISYVRKDQHNARPVILHQAMYGSIERWIGILLECYQGKLPHWLHPVPVAIATIKSNLMEYAGEIQRLLRQADIPVLLDASENTVSRKIKRFHNMYIPYMIVVGEEEQKNRSVSLRVGNQTQVIAIHNLISQLSERLTEPK